MRDSIMGAGVLTARETPREGRRRCRVPLAGRERPGVNRQLARVNQSGGLRSGIPGPGDAATSVPLLSLTRRWGARPSAQRLGVEGWTAWPEPALSTWTLSAGAPPGRSAGCLHEAPKALIPIWRARPGGVSLSLGKDHFLSSSEPPPHSSSGSSRGAWRLPFPARLDP